MKDEVVELIQEQNLSQDTKTEKISEQISIIKIQQQELNKMVNEIQV